MSTPKSQIRLSQMTGSFGAGSGQINDAVNSEAAIDDGNISVTSLDGALSYMAAAIRRIHGSSTSFSSAAKGTFYTTLKSDSAGNIDLGSTTDADKFGDIFVADTKGLKLGNAEEHTIVDSSSGLAIDSSEGISIDAAAASNLSTSAGDLTLEAGGSSNKVVIKGDHASGVAIHLDANEGSSSEIHMEAGVIDMDATGAATLDAGGAINITGAGVDVNAGSGTLELTSSGAVDVNGAAITVDGTTVSVDGSDDMNFTMAANSSSSQTMTIAASNSGSGAGVIDMDADGAITVDAGAGLSLDAAADSNFTLSDGDLSLIADGADNKVVIKGDHTSGVAVHIDANESSSSEVQIDAGVLDVDVTAAATIDAGGSISLTGAGINLDGGSTEIDITSTGAVDINSAAFTVDGSTVSIDGTDAMNFTMTANSSSDATMAITASNSGSGNGLMTLTADTVTIAGNLDVNGTTTTIDTTSVAISDHNIVLDRDNSTSAVIDGCGLTMEGGSGDDITLQQLASGDRLELKKGSSYHPLAAKQLLVDGTSDHIAVSSSVLTLTAGTSFEVASAGDIVLDSGGDVVIDGTSQKLEFGSAGSGEHITGDGDDLTVASGRHLVLDATETLKLDSDSGDISFEDGGVAQLAIDMDGTSGQVDIQLKVDSDDLVFKQYDGTEVIRIGDDRRLYFADQGGEYIVGDESKLQIYSGADLELRATDKVVLQSNIELNLDGDMGSNELVYDSTNNKLTVKAGGDLELSLGNASSNQIVPAADNTHDLGRIASLGSGINAEDLDNNLTSGQSITMATTGRNAILYGNSVSVSAGSAISGLAGSAISASSVDSSTTEIYLSGFSGDTISAGTVLEFTEGSDKMYFVVLADVESSASKMDVKHHSGISGQASSLSFSSGVDSVKPATASSGAFAHSSPSISAGHAISFADSSSNLYAFEVMAAPSSNSLAVVVDALSELSSGTSFSASSVSSNSGKVYSSYKSGLKFNQLAIEKVDFSSAIFMSGSSDGIHFKAESGDRFQFDDAPLYLKDLSSAPSTTTNRLYSLSGGIYWNGNLLMAKKAKEVSTVTSGVSAGVAHNITNMAHDQGKNPLKTDVYLNGQLMMSGSSASTGDYTISHTDFDSLSSLSIASSQSISTSTTSLSVTLSSGASDSLKAGSMIKMAGSSATAIFRVSESPSSSADSLTGTVVFTEGSSLSTSDSFTTTVSTVVDNDDVVFHFALEVDDVVQVVVMA